MFPLGPADAPPLPPLNLLADFGGGGAYLALGLLAALHQRWLTGRGQVVDAAMVDGVASLTTMLHGMLAAGPVDRPPGREPAGRRGAFLPHVPHGGRLLHGRGRP